MTTRAPAVLKKVTQVCAFKGDLSMFIIMYFRGQVVSLALRKLRRKFETTLRQHGNNFGTTGRLLLSDHWQGVPLPMGQRVAMEGAGFC